MPVVTAVAVLVVVVVAVAARGQGRGLDGEVVKRRDPVLVRRCRHGGHWRAHHGVVDGNVGGGQRQTAESTTAIAAAAAESRSEVAYLPRDLAAALVLGIRRQHLGGVAVPVDAPADLAAGGRAHHVHRARSARPPLREVV